MPRGGKRDPAKCKRDPWRPPKYTTPEDLQGHIDDYFEYCKKTLITIKHMHSKGVTKTKVPTPPTMAGLAEWLHVDRNTLNNWKKEDSFFSVITQARKKIENNNIVMGQV